MRKLITGVDDSGRSCIVEESDLVLGPAGPPGILSVLLATTSSSPPPPRPLGRSNTNDLGVRPGLVGWFLVEYEPNLDYPSHNTDTVDFDTVLEGSVLIGLDDGDHVLETGDFVVVNGVDHSWKAGPDGCKLSVLSLGTHPPAGGE
jgi:quercetin dioxygenase-like cupin family protein